MGKRQAGRKQRRQEAMRKRVLLIVLGLAGLAAVLAFALPVLFPGLGQDVTANLVKPAEKPFPEADLNRLGSKDAPVKVVEFADYLCSHCQEFTLVEEKSFIENYVSTGKVQFEYLSVAFQSPNQTKPIDATYCAGDQNAFWPYRELVYANIAENSNALNDNYLVAYAKELNLDINTFNNCLETGKYKDRNQENVQKAREAQIPGTPTFLVNGVKASYVELKTMIESELAKTGSK